jgi:hypothetical protein
MGPRKRSRRKRAGCALCPPECTRGRRETPNHRPPALLPPRSRVGDHYTPRGAGSLRRIEPGINTAVRSPRTGGFCVDVRAVWTVAWVNSRSVTSRAPARHRARSTSGAGARTDRHPVRSGQRADGRNRNENPVARRGTPRRTRRTYLAQPWRPTKRLATQQDARRAADRRVANVHRTPTATSLHEGWMPRPTGTSVADCSVLSPRDASIQFD